MKTKSFLHAVLALGLGVALGLVPALVAQADDDDDGGAPLPFQQVSVSTLEDPLIGICKARKTAKIRFCSHDSGGGGTDDDDDDNGTRCDACPVGTFEYQYIVKNRGSLPMASVTIPVASSANVISAGFFDSLKGTAAPDSTNIQATNVVWIFGTNPIDPPPAGPLSEGEVSETLFICSDLCPNEMTAGANCGPLDAEGPCQVPSDPAPISDPDDASDDDDDDGDPAPYDDTNDDTDDDDDDTDVPICPSFAQPPFSFDDDD